MRDTFGLQRKFEDFPLLDKWLAVKNNLTEAEKTSLESLRSTLYRNVDFWNEETLKMKFIAFILGMVNYSSEEYQSFFDAELEAVVEGYPLKNRADFVVATATADFIKAPYFCFHEYKRERKQSDDPIAQVLMAMLIGQTKNPKPRPIYGCYVMGRNWFFMILDGKDFIVSNAFNATETEDLQQILLVLREFKVILTEQLLR